MLGFEGGAPRRVGRKYPPAKPRGKDVALGFHSTKAYVGMRTHTYHTRSGAWASQHHIGTSRVHWSHSAPPLSRRTHPPRDAVGNADHLQLQLDSPSSTPLYVVHVPLPFSGEVLGLYLLSPYCPCTTGSFKSGNPYKPIYSGTAVYGEAPQAETMCFLMLQR